MAVSETKEDVETKVSALEIKVDSEKKAKALVDLLQLYSEIKVKATLQARVTAEKVVRTGHAGAILVGEATLAEEHMERRAKAVLVVARGAVTEQQAILIVLVAMALGIKERGAFAGVVLETKEVVLVDAVLEIKARAALAAKEALMATEVILIGAAKMATKASLIGEAKMAAKVFLIEVAKMATKVFLIGGAMPKKAKEVLVAVREMTTVAEVTLTVVTESLEEDQS